MGNKTLTRRISIPQTTVTQQFSGDPIVTSFSNDFTLGFSRIGVDNPMFQSLINAGSGATNSMSVTVTELNYTPGRLLYTYNPVNSVNFGKISYHTASGVGIQLPTAVWQSDVSSDALNKAAIGIRKKIKEVDQKFSGPTFLGELSQTIALIKSPASALRGHTGLFLDRMARQKAKQNKRQFSKTLADSWLEYSFGVAPLIKDITSIAEAAQNMVVEPHLKRESFTGFAEKATSDLRSGVTPFGLNTYYSRDVIDRCKAIYTVGVRPEVLRANNALEAVIAQGGFNLNEVLPTAWELLPWSFLIDYFSNIGDVISAATTSMTNVRWVQLTTIEETLFRVHSGNIEPNPAAGHKFIGGTFPLYTATQRRIVRSTAAIPIPGIRFELPGRPAQFLNMAALAIMRFK